MGNGSARDALGHVTGAALALALMAGAAQAAGACDPASVHLRAGGSEMRFSVEVADEEAERSKGLMFRESMPASSGMLFVYPRPQRAMFWMKNTLIPLDMIFVDSTGRVTRVHEGAIPGDETPIDGGQGVQFVLEINAGLAAAMGIEPGAELRHPAIAQETAAWACN